MYYPYRYQRNKTQELLDTILSIQPKESSSGGGETREASVYRQSKEMLEKVPPNFDPHEVKERSAIILLIESSYFNTLYKYYLPIINRSISVFIFYFNLNLQYFGWFLLHPIYMWHFIFLSGCDFTVFLTRW